MTVLIPSQDILVVLISCCLIKLNKSTQVKTEKDFEVVNKHIVACIVLYNYLRLINDDWIVHEQLDEELQVEEEVQAGGGVDAIVTAGREDAGKILRTKVQNECLEWYYRRIGRLTY